MLSRYYLKLFVLLALLALSRGGITYGKDKTAVLGKKEKALFKAIGYHNKPDAVASLIKKGVNVNAIDEEGFSPLMYACWGYKNAPAVVRLLLNAGAKVNEKMGSGIFPLECACSSERNSDSITKMLLDAGAEVNLRNNYGSTALIAASEVGNTGAVKILLAAGASVNMQDNHGETALLLASGEILHFPNDLPYDRPSLGRNSFPEIISLLLKAGADVNAQNNIDGGTALIAVCVSQCRPPRAKYEDDIKPEKLKRIVADNLRSLNILLDAGADISIKNKAARTALMSAEDLVKFEENHHSYDNDEAIVMRHGMIRIIKEYSKEKK